MKTVILMMSVLILTAQAGFAAERVLTCAQSRITATQGIRVNVIESGNKTKLVLFEGSTMSSWNTYTLVASRADYLGSDRKGRTIQLSVTGKAKTNRYIRGYAAQLVYANAPDARVDAGPESWSA